MPSTDNNGRRKQSDRRGGDRRKAVRLDAAPDRRQGERRSRSDRRGEPR